MAEKHSYDEDDENAAKAAFSRRLCALMDQRGLTGSEVARRMREHLPKSAKASRAIVSHYRKGRALPRLHYLDALSSALGVDRTELLPTLNPKPAGRSGERGREAAMKVAPANTIVVSARPAKADVPSCIIEDFGDEVHLGIDQRVSWDVALKILAALKGAEKEQEDLTAPYSASSPRLT